MSRIKAVFHEIYGVAGVGDRGERVKGNEVERFAGGGKGTDFIGIYNHAKN